MPKITPAPLTRPLYVIAREIGANWEAVHHDGTPDPNLGGIRVGQHPANPYWEAMRSLDKLDGAYGRDSASSIVAGFIGAAGQWKGELARAIKVELKAALEHHYAAEKAARRR